MKTTITKLAGNCALFFLAVSVLNLAACKKEATVTPVNQRQATANIQGDAAVTTNDKINVDLFVSIPCANGGLGEDVQLSGFLHELVTFTINGNNVRGKYHYQPQGITGVGMTTGDKYQATGQTQDEFSGSLVNGQYEETFVNNFRIIGQGNGNNFIIHENFHVTITANGVVTTVIDNVTTDCK